MMANQAPAIPPGQTDEKVLLEYRSSQQESQKSQNQEMQEEENEGGSGELDDFNNFDEASPTRNGEGDEVERDEVDR